MKTKKKKNMEYGKVIIEKREILRARFFFAGAGHKSRRADQRVMFMARLSGAVGAILRDAPKSSPALWGSDKVLVVQVRFLKGYRNLQ